MVFDRGIKSWALRTRSSSVTSRPAKKDSCRAATTVCSISAPEKPSPQVFDYRITSAYPNPFNPSTTITYTVPHAGAFTIAIYNLLGQEVERFDLHPASAGQYTLQWNAQNHSGTSVPSGLYFAKMHAENITSTHKLLLLR
jgi:hypothetical protein